MPKDTEQDRINSVSALMETMTPDDRIMVLLVHLLETLADDLAYLKIHGYWKLHPDEIRQHSGRNVYLPSDRFGDRLTPLSILEEYQSPEIADLCQQISDMTRRTVKISTSFILRMANYQARKLASKKKQAA